MALWQGVNQGLRTGLAVSGDIQQQQRQQKLDGERAEDRQYQRGLQATQLERQAKQDQRQEGQDALAVASGLESEVRNQARAAMQTGGFGSAEEAANYHDLKESARATKSKGRQLLGYEAKMQEAAQTMEAIKGGTPLDQIPGQQLGDALSYTFGHAATDFLDGDGPGPVGKAYTDFAEGMQSGNMAALLSGVNGLLRPEIEQGVGQTLKNGDVITGKRAAGVYPSARDPKKGVLDLVVKARKPDGTEYEYPAWATEGRKEGGKELEFDVTQGLDRISAYGELLGALNDPSVAPVVQQKLAEWKKAGGDAQWAAFRKDYIAFGGNPADLKAKTTRDKLDLGDRVIERQLDEQGNPIGETEYKKGATPRAPSTNPRTPRGLAADIATIRDEIDAGTIDPDDGKALIEEALANRGAGRKKEGPHTLEAMADKIHEENLKNWRAVAGGLRGSDAPAPKYEDAVAEAKRRMPAGDPPPAKQGGADPAARQTQAPMRTPAVGEGAIAINKETGQRIQRVNGQWRPVQ